MIIHQAAIFDEGLEWKIVGGGSLLNFRSTFKIEDSIETFCLELLGVPLLKIDVQENWKIPFLFSWSQQFFILILFVKDCLLTEFVFFYPIPVCSC